MSSNSYKNYIILKISYIIHMFSGVMGRSKRRVRRLRRHAQTRGREGGMAGGRDGVRGRGGDGGMAGWREGVI